MSRKRPDRLAGVGLGIRSRSRESESGSRQSRIGNGSRGRLSGTTFRGRGVPGARSPFGPALGAPRRECRAVTGSFRLIRAIAVPTGPAAPDPTRAGPFTLQPPAPANRDQRWLQFPVPLSHALAHGVLPRRGGVAPPSSPHPFPPWFWMPALSSGFRPSGPLYWMHCPGLDARLSVRSIASPNAGAAEDRHRL